MTWWHAGTRWHAMFSIFLFTLVLSFVRVQIKGIACHCVPRTEQRKPKYFMNRKAKGTKNEHRSMAVLEACGYRTTRSAASLGAWDIIGIGSQDVVLCQVKTRDWPGTVEMEQLREFAIPPGVRKLVHRWRDRQRLPDTKELT